MALPDLPEMAAAASQGVISPLSAATVGDPLSRLSASSFVVLGFLSGSSRFVVLELSSYQLEALSDLAARKLPHIAGRTGCDVAPFRLTNETDELTLMAFIWGDQVDRLERLREGIDAFHLVTKSDSPAPISP